MGLRSMLDGFKRKNEVYKELEAEDKATEKLQQKKLTANERALNRILEDKRQEQIANELKKYNKKEQNEFWHKDVITQKEIFKDKNSILAQKNIFVHQPNLFTNEESLF